MKNRMKNQITSPVTILNLKRHSQSNAFSKITHKILGSKKLYLIIIFLLGSILYCNAQTNDMIAVNFSNTNNGISNPVKTNHEMDGLPGTPSSIYSESLKVDENNNIMVQIENENLNGADVAIVKVIVNGVITQKLVFKGETMSCVEFPDIVKTKKPVRNTHNICE
jgi:hypothetical protein